MGEGCYGAQAAFAGAELGSSAGRLDRPLLQHHSPMKALSQGHSGSVPSGGAAGRK